MLEDCVLLAQGMKFKSLFHRLPYAGAKVCIELTPDADERLAYTALGEFVANSWDDLITTGEMTWLRAIGIEPRFWSHLGA